jgi:autotransporter-associated beta strand protein
MKLPQFLLASALLAALAQPAAHAQALWDGGGGNNNWSTGANWDGDSAPSSGTNLDFGGTTRTSSNNNVAGVFTASTIQILSSATSGFAISGSNLLTGNFIMQAGAGNSSISNPVRTSAGSGYSFNLASGTQLTYSGLITNLAAGDVGRNLTLLGGGTLVISNTNNTFSNDSGTASGNVQIDNGTLRVTSAIGDYGSNSPLGQMVGTGTPGIRLGNAATNGTFEYTGGASSTNRRFRLGNGAAGTGGGSILNNGSGTLTLTGTLIIADTAATVARTLTLGGSNNGVISGAIADNNTVGGGTVGITKTDAGTWTLSGNNTYTGGTTVSAGTLLVNNTVGSGTGTSTVTVNTGGTLGGNGSISGDVTVNAGGTFAPGTSAGLLEVGSLSLAGDSEFEIDGLTRGVVGGYDAADVTGALTYGGTLSLVFSNTFANGSNFNLFDFSSQSGNWSGVDLTGSYTGSLSFSGGLWTGNVGGQDFEFSNATGVLSVIPEPSTWALLGVSLMAILFSRRRHARA